MLAEPPISSPFKLTIHYRRSTFGTASRKKLETVEKRMYLTHDVKDHSEQLTKIHHRSRHENIKPNRRSEQNSV
jgi:hypothetical protein